MPIPAVALEPVSSLSILPSTLVPYRQTNQEIPTTPTSGTRWYRHNITVVSGSSVATSPGQQAQFNWRGQWKKGISHIFDKMEFCMLLLRSTHLLFARNVLSTHTQSFWVIRNNYLNANFSNRVIFTRNAFMQVTTISKYSKTDWKSHYLQH